MISRVHVMEYVLWNHLWRCGTRQMTSRVHVMEYILWNHSWRCGTRQMTSRVHVMEYILWNHWWPCGTRQMTSRVHVMEYILWNHVWRCGTRQMTSRVHVMEYILWNHVCRCGTRQVKSPYVLLWMYKFWDILICTFLYYVCVQQMHFEFKEIQCTLVYCDVVYVYPWIQFESLVSCCVWVYLVTEIREVK